MPVRLESLTYAVLFDAVGTLIEPHPAVAAAYAAAGCRFGSSLAQPEIEARFRAAFTRREGIDAADGMGATSEAGEQARWRAIVGEIFDDVADAEPLFDALWEHFAAAKHWRLMDGAAEAWRRLDSRQVNGRRLVVGIASNFDSRLESVCSGLPPLAGCPLFISSRLGHRKPAPAFFRAVEARLGRKPEELLLVGDDLVNDYQGALAAGWQAVLVDRHDRFEGTRRVRSLMELVSGEDLIERKPRIEGR
ncbi:MAG TPA: HAD-IA family hydrolase [Pirellulales bacterium]|nr:HAD-IA family hydrolase [Pirellulales bacterium]